MKTTILAIALSITATAATALNDEVCKKFGDMAYKFALGRQDGLPLSDAMTVLSVSKDNPDFQRMLRALILSAYSLPVMTGKESQNAVATEYGQQVALSCYQAK